GDQYSLLELKQRSVTRQIWELDRKLAKIAIQLITTLKNINVNHSNLTNNINQNTIDSIIAQLNWIPITTATVLLNSQNNENNSNNNNNNVVQVVPIIPIPGIKKVRVPAHFNNKEVEM